MRYFTAFLVIFLIFAILFRFIGFVLIIVFKFWYIALALGLYLYFRSKRSVKVVKEDTVQQLDPSKEVKLEKDAEVKDEQ